MLVRRARIPEVQEVSPTLVPLPLEALVRLGQEQRELLEPGIPVPGPAELLLRSTATGSLEAGHLLRWTVDWVDPF